LYVVLKGEGYGVVMIHSLVPENEVSLLYFIFFFFLLFFFFFFICCFFLLPHFL
jgi:hypothetical protein